MSGAHIQVRVPGKLMVAGEYAVLEQNHEAVVVAVNRFVTATIAFDSDNRLYLPGLGLNQLTWKQNQGQIDFSIQDVRLRYIGQAIAIVLDFLQYEGIQTHPFRLELQSQLDDSVGRKYGLGSSAAVVVAVVSAVLHLYHFEKYADELVFKLAAIAHLLAQGNGSGADVAASTFGGWIRYTSFQADWLLAKLEQNSQPHQLVWETWPYFHVSRLQPPPELHLCVGWTGEPASTAPLVQAVRAMKVSNLADYQTFLKRSVHAVTVFIRAIETQHLEQAIAAIEQNRTALWQLGLLAGIPIETPKLFELHQIAQQFGGAGKPSGAGGGDCGIALMMTGMNHIYALQQAWKNVGIEPLAISVSMLGAHLLEQAL